MDDNYNLITNTRLLGEEARKRFDHVALRLDHYIVVFGGSWWHDVNEFEFEERPLPLNVIWMYNLYTEKWSKHGLSVGTMPPSPTYDTCAAVIDSVIYMFGGKLLGRTRTRTLTNALWKLVKKPNACFEWSEIITLSKAKSPSPRARHNGWEYDGKLWAFGGTGESPIVFLNNHGDYDFQSKLNNQLICFDPTCQEWMNLQCFGSIPPPIAGHATTIITDNVWQYGGYTDASMFGLDQLYELNMPSLFWTRIDAEYPWAYYQVYCSFTALTNTYIVLHRGYCPWILDLSALSWKELTFVVDGRRMSHTCTRDNNSNGVVIGGRLSY